jgi:hypothetical protein
LQTLLSVFQTNCDAITIKAVIASDETTNSRLHYAAAVTAVEFNSSDTEVSGHFQNARKRFLEVSLNIGYSDFLLG